VAGHERGDLAKPMDFSIPSRRGFHARKGKRWKFTFDPKWLPRGWLHKSGYLGERVFSYHVFVVDNSGEFREESGR